MHARTQNNYKKKKGYQVKLKGEGNQTQPRALLTSRVIIGQKRGGGCLSILKEKDIEKKKRLNPK